MGGWCASRTFSPPRATSWTRLRAPTDRHCPLRQVEEANEKVNLASMAAAGSLWRIYPHRDAEGRVAWFTLADRLPADMAEDEWLFVRRSMDYVAERVAARQWNEVGDILSKNKDVPTPRGGRGAACRRAFRGGAGV